MITIQEYKNILNKKAPVNYEAYIIGGKFRKLYFNRLAYAEALEKFDPVKFNQGYNDYRRESYKIKY